MGAILINDSAERVYAVAKVRPTLEVILSQSPSYMKHVHDPRSGLALVRAGA